MVTSTPSTSEQSPLLMPGSETLSKRRMMPQTIAHRGFHEVVPENTMMAFKAAVAEKVEALETDLHLSRDGVIVLCHDASLVRTFGKKAKIRDLDWEELSQLRTVREPHLTMPRLIDLLEYLAEPDLEHIWLMLDIKPKPGPDAEVMMRTISETLASVPTKRPWSERVTPCCWRPNYIKFSLQYLPDYHVTHLSATTNYARYLTKVPNISFSILQFSLATPSGTKFIRDMKKLGIPVYVWTSNSADWMEWGIRQELDGVITDQVTLFHQVCDRMSETSRPAIPMTSKLSRTIRFWGQMMVYSILIAIFMPMDWLMNGLPRSQVRKSLTL
ncbi:PLC-like phosphodiesterase [Xylariaceae sp. FL0255]|nr:PLC-like phosphodiesterase [Xylariaceae sp. FL0255]